MPEDLSAEYYQNNKERLQKSAPEKYWERKEATIWF